MTATMSVLGLYNWDNTLFSLLSVPEGLDKETLVDFILAECSDLETLYPNPDVLKGLIGVWSVTQQYEWNKLYNTLTLEYNPIDNYDRTETREFTSQAAGNSTDGGTDTVTSADTGTDTATSADTGTNTVTSADTGTNTVTSADTGTDTTSENSTDLNQVKAFDSANFADKEKDTVNNSGSTTYGKTNTNTAVFGKTNTNTTNYGKTNTNTARYGHTNNNTFAKNDTENIRAHGNIGTVTTQAMIEAERNIAAFNLYQIILNEFKQRFCLLVY